jgi:YbbR domain-containing protein
VNVENPNPHLTVTNVLPQVHVRIRANRNLPPSQASFFAFVDLTRFHRGLHTVRVQVSADPGIQVLKVTPSHVRVMLDTQTERTVPVRAHISSKPQPGFIIGGAIQLNPSTVRVSGPDAMVSQVTQAAVYVDLTGARTSVTGTYRPALVNGQNTTMTNRLVTMDPPVVHLTLPIIPLSGFKTLPIVPSIRGVPRAGFGIVGASVSPVEATVYGSPNSLRGLSSISTSPVWVAKRTGGRLRQVATLQLPRGVRSSVSRVWVSVQIGAVGVTQSVQIPLKVASVAKGLRATPHPTAVTVSLFGQPAQLQRARAGLRALLDLGSLRAGGHQVQPRIQVPAGVQVEAVYPSRVTVTLTPAGGG